MIEMIKEGMWVEILDAKIDKEEPGAASSISWALNEGNSIALATTEISAMAVLSGEIIAQQSRDLGQMVAFDSVVAAVKTQLGPLVADPDLVEVFDFLLKLGVDKNTFFADLLEFLEKYVNSKLRQMRLAGFATLNKIGDRYPHGIVAATKRAYRKDAVKGFVPGPEPNWTPIRPHFKKNMEDLLRFFHQACKPIIVHGGPHVPPQSRILFIANLDVAIADATYIYCKGSGDQPAHGHKVKMCQATLQAYEQLGLPATRKRLAISLVLP